MKLRALGASILVAMMLVELDQLIILLAQWPSLQSTTSILDLLTLSPPQNHAVKSNREHRPIITKYIKYGTQGGWSNQLICLERALWLAHALNRTLILPPMIPHFEVTHGTLNKKSIDEIYSKQSPYVPLQSVIDFPLSIPHVLPVIDFQSLYNANHTFTDISISETYNFTNTIWTRNTPLGINNTRQTIHTRMYGRELDVTVTYRDIQRELSQFESYDILTFKKVFEGRHFHETMVQPVLNLTYAAPIRSAARQVMKRLGPYAAIHLRGGDGIFKRRNLTEVMVETLDQIGAQIEDYHHSQQDDSSPRSNQTNTYRLLVITDLSDLEERSNWKSSCLTLQSRLKQTQNLTLDFVYSSFYKRVTEELSSQLQNPDVDICMDQQLATCAPIGFTGYRGSSSFSRRITQMRKSHSSCT